MDTNVTEQKERRARRWLYQGHYQPYPKHSKDHTAKLKRYYALYGLFRQNPDGSIDGYCEESFSMGWYNHCVEPYEYSSALKICRSYQKKNKNKNIKYFICRITAKSKNAKITVIPPNPALSCGKFKWRNWEFKINKGN